MTEVLLNRVDSFINEDKWTRSALSNYTVSQFRELEDVLDDAEKEGARQELKIHCQETLQNSKGSLVAQYLAGILSWQDNQLDDSSIGSLLALFESHSKWTIIEYLCEKMLETAESKMALTYLVRAYEHQGNDALYYSALERLSRIDYEDADLALTLAKRYEEEGRTQDSLAFYKKAIYRLINRKQFNSIQQVWQKILEHGVENEDVFDSILMKVEKIMGQESASELKKMLYKMMRKEGRVDVSITLLKDILEVNPRDQGLRKDLLECYEEKYKNHSRLAECVHISDIAHGFRNVQEAIKIFEKHISLDTGRFVFHRMYGVGRIRSINQDQVEIDFAKKRKHSMGLEMAVNSLVSLADDHIWVLKSIVARDKLKEKIRADIPWALKILANSFGGRADLKKIKAELSPSGDAAKRALLSASEWSDFSQKARQIIKTDSRFGNDQNHADVYVLRTTPVSYEEKLTNSFRSEENFFKRLAIMQEFLDSADLTSEFFSDMINYFLGYLKLPQTNEHVVASYLLVQKLSKINLGIPAPAMPFGEFFATINSPETVFVRLENNDIRQAFLLQVKQHLEEWQNIYLLLLPHIPQKMMIDELLALNMNDEIKEAFKKILSQYRSNPLPFFWLVSYLRETAQYEALGVDEEKVYLALLHLVDISHRNINGRKDLVTNKRILRQAMNALFKEGHLVAYLEGCSKDTAVRLYSLLKDIKNLDMVHRHATQKILGSRFPDLDFSEEERQKEQVASKPGRSSHIWTTQKSFNEKSALLKQLIEVEIPKNSAEIGEAIKKGDLKENAEYIFGKEKQEQLQVEVGRLQKELDTYRVFDPATLDTKFVGFGVTVLLKDAEGGTEEEYTFLGPWESDPDARILSYLAPFAEPMLGKKTGQSVKFAINERNYHYKIGKIKAASQLGA
ncbi:MAG: transcription elongation factor GreA [Spirochaetia bacterium]